MSFDWIEFLTLAEALKSDPDSPGPSEAALRSATSRAYYAAFHSALNSACKEGFSPSYFGDDHRAVPEHFRTFKPTDTRQKIALDLDRSRDNRRKADYDGDLTTKPSSLAYYTIKMARSVLRNLDSLTEEQGATVDAQE